MLIIGLALFFGGPYFIRNNLSISELIPLRNSASVGPNSSILLGSAPPGYILIGIYNDSPPLPIKIAGAGLNVTRADGYYVFELYNLGASQQSVYAFNNNSQAVELYYSVMQVSASKIFYSVAVLFVGGALVVVGGITALVGFFLRPKKRS